MKILTKICKGKCGLEKPLPEFHKNKNNKIDGRVNKCKSCLSIAKPKPPQEIFEPGFKRCIGGQLHCNEIKPLSEFYKQDGMSDGYMNTCKQCKRDHQEQFRKENPEYRKQYYENHKEQELEQHKQWIINNPDKGKEYNKNWRENNPDIKKESDEKWRKENPDYRKQYYQNNKEEELEQNKQWNQKNPDYHKQYAELHKEEIEEYSKQYYQNNKEEILENGKQWIINNPEKKKEINKKYRQDNKDEINEYNKQYLKNKRKTDHLFRLQESMRRMLRKTLKLVGTKKEGRTNDNLGYSPEKLNLRLSVNFTDKMWNDNYGEWEIDHTISVDHFFKNGITDPKIINALSNLRPRWKTSRTINGVFYLGNIEKSNKLVHK